MSRWISFGVAQSPEPVYSGTMMKVSVCYRLSSKKIVGMAFFSGGAHRPTGADAGRLDRRRALGQAAQGGRDHVAQAAAAREDAGLGRLHVVHRVEALRVEALDDGDDAGQLLARDDRQHDGDGA